MNAFYEHHHRSIKLAYRCFDRILLNGLIQPFQQPERVMGFFNACREGVRVTRNLLREIGQAVPRTGWRTARGSGVRPSSRRPPADAMSLSLPISSTPGRIRWSPFLKAREPARIMTAIGSGVRWHLQIAWRWVLQDSVYLCDRHWALV